MTFEEWWIKQGQPEKLKELFRQCWEDGFISGYEDGFDDGTEREFDN